jgi:Protein of unknown function (DUF1091)
VHIEHRGITPYYNTVINSTIATCSYLNGTDKNPIAKWIVGIFKDSVPNNYVHPCPYFGYYNFSNVTFDFNSLISSFLTGTYRATTRNYDDEDDNIFTVIYELEYEESSRKRN